MDADLKQLWRRWNAALSRANMNWKRSLREYIDTRMQQQSRELSEYIDERTHDTETRIVRAFGAYQQSSGIRFRKLESDVSNVNASTTEQMDAFQSKCWS